MGFHKSGHYVEGCQESTIGSREAVEPILESGKIRLQHVETYYSLKEKKMVWGKEGAALHTRSDNQNRSN